jgi:outer membrane protein assembly factor BamB
MRNQALAALLVCLCAGALSAGFSLGRPAAVKKRVDRLDDKVVAFQAAKAPPNRAPVISGIAALSATVAAGGPASLTVTASDPEGNVLSYVWTSTAGAIVGSSTSVNLSWIAPSTPGVYAVTCTVSDGKGGTALRSAAITAVPPGTKKWEFPTTDHVRASPAIADDGTIYAASNDGKLYAINPDGTAKWALPFVTDSGSPINSSPAIDVHGNIYFGDDNGDFYSVSPSTGGLRWAFHDASPNSINSSPAIGADGTVYFGDNDGNLYALDGSDGNEKWIATWAASHAITASPAIDAYGTVYFGSTDGHVYAVDPADGSAPKWMDTLGGAGMPFTSSPAIGADGTIYEGSDDGILHAMNYGDGSPKSAWSSASYTGSGPIKSSPAVGPDGTVYFGADDGNLHALDGSGSQKWAAVIGGSLTSSPAIGADGTVYVGADDGSVYAVDANSLTGAQKWVSPPAAGPIVSSPAIGTDGTVYAGSDDGRLYAFYGTTPLATAPWPKFHRNAASTGR